MVNDTEGFFFEANNNGNSVDAEVINAKNVYDKYGKNNENS